MSAEPGAHRRAPTSSAVLVYVIVLVALQLFLVTVAADAFLADDEGLAWATAALSVVLFLGAAAFLRVFRQ
jgi:positive regulator of sigma E activity